MDLEILVTNKDEKGLPFFGKKALIELFDTNDKRLTSHILKAGEANSVTINDDVKYATVRVKGT